MTDDGVRWQFISEEIRPVRGHIDAGRMALGEPGVPMRFTWRGVEYEVADVLDSWKSTGREGGSPTGEAYVRRHWTDLRTTSGERMVIYCLRQSPGRGRSRWWLCRIGQEQSA